jgi:hypothetical protein
MSRDWKLIGKGLVPEVPEAQLEKLQATLQTLETHLASLKEIVPHDTEPATIFVANEEHT